MPRKTCCSPACRARRAAGFNEAAARCRGKLAGVLVEQFTDEELQ